MVIERRKEQKQVVIKHKLKYIQKHVILPLKFGINGTNKESKENKELVKNFISLKLINGGVLIRSGGVGEKLQN